MAYDITSGRTQLGQELRKLAAPRLVERLEEPPMAAGGRHQVVDRQPRLPTQQHTQCQVLVDDYHGSGSAWAKRALGRFGRDEFQPRHLPPERSITSSCEKLVDEDRPQPLLVPFPGPASVDEQAVHLGRRNGVDDVGGVALSKPGPQSARPGE
jgi:hypothetical protein